MPKCVYCECVIEIPEITKDGAFFSNEEIEEIRASNFDVMETVDKILKKKKG